VLVVRQEFDRLQRIGHLGTDCQILGMPPGIARSKKIKTKININNLTYNMKQMNTIQNIKTIINTKNNKRYRIY
jgi:hypothetical protein